MQRSLPTAVALGAAVGFSLIACKKLIRLLLDHGNAFPQFVEINYPFSVLVPNYFLSGFMRRGLAGTIMALIDQRPGLVAVASFHVFSAIWLCIAIALILGMVLKANLRIGIWLAIVVVLSPQFRFWGLDIGRYDMLSLGFVILMLVAALHSRWLVAATILAVGSLSHETVVILGGPLLLATWYVDYRDGKASLSTIIAPLVLLGALLGSIALLQRAFPTDPVQIAAAIKAAAPPSPFRDIAIYISAADSVRMVTTSLCGMRMNNAYPVYLVSGFVFVPFYLLILGYRGNRHHLLLFGLVAIVPMAFLTIVATDYGRWFALGAFNAWLCTAMLAIRAGNVVAPPRLNLLVAVPALALLLAAGHTTISAANVLTVDAAKKIWERPTVPPMVSMKLCDPDWRDVVDGKGADPSRPGGRE